LLSQQKASAQVGHDPTQKDAEIKYEGELPRDAISCKGQGENPPPERNQTQPTTLLCDPGLVFSGGSMKARQLIRSASYGPDTLRILFQAFDDAWNAIRPSVSDDAIATEAARLQLASILLSLAREDSLNSEQLKDATLRTYRLMRANA
jgi:hypothetical protein